MLRNMCRDPSTRFLALRWQRNLVQTLFSLLILMTFGSRGLSAYVKPPSYTDPDFIQKCVNDHNTARASVSPSASDMRYMTWDPLLAASAQAWAEKCIFDHHVYPKELGHPHQNFTRVGQNIWIGSGNVKVSPTHAWVAEDKFYDYNTGVCSNVCGHYTQVVWAESYKVGCGAHFCRNLAKVQRGSDWIIVVCNYGPPGNYRKPPYSAGQSCSKCPKGDICPGSLCKNTGRDAVKGQKGTNDDTCRGSLCKNVGRDAAKDQKATNDDTCQGSLCKNAARDAVKDQKAINGDTCQGSLCKNIGHDAAMGQNGTVVDGGVVSMYVGSLWHIVWLIFIWTFGSALNPAV